MTRSPSEVVATLRAAGCVYAEDEAALLLDADGDLGVLLARRVAGEPLEQVLGWAAFRGLRVRVAPGVFVPRRRTELLAELAIVSSSPGTVVVDLCCGVGAVAAAVIAEAPGASVYAADVDPVAVEVARTNVPAGRAFCGDLFDALPDALRGGVDVVVANTPYVPSAEVALLPPEARQHEPLHTLDGGADGLALLRRIAAESGPWLAPSGKVLIEIAEQQVAAATSAGEVAGLDVVIHRDDSLGAVVVQGQR